MANDLPTLKDIIAASEAMNAPIERPMNGTIVLGDELNTFIDGEIIKVEKIEG